MSTIRRLYLYVVSFAALLVTALGAITLLSTLTDTLFQPTTLAGEATTQIALALAMLVIGGPVWLLHWLVAERVAARNATDRRAELRHVYLNLVLWVTFVASLTSALPIVLWLLGTRDEGQFVLPALSRLAVWSALWAYHWWIVSREGVAATRRTLHRWYLYAATAGALGMLVIGANGVLSALGASLYAALFARPLVSEPLWSDPLRVPLSLTLVGLGAWSFHWLYAARGDTGSTLRQVYLSLVAVLGGLAAVLIALGMTIYQTLRYALDASAFAPAAHFAFLPVVVPPGLIGLVVGLYHWQVLQRETGTASAGAPTVRRSYRYILTAAGLATWAGGAGVLLALLIGLPTAPFSLTTDWWRDPLSLALALLFVGAPLWVFQWTHAQQEVARWGVAERQALPRRLMLYGTVTLTILSLLGNLVYVLFRVLDALLQARLSWSVVFAARGNLAAVIASAVILAYYALVLANDRRRGAEEMVGRKDVLLWVAPAYHDLAPALSQALAGNDVQVLEGAADGLLPQEFELTDTAGAATSVIRSPGQRSLVVVAGGHVQVYPCRA